MVSNRHLVAAGLCLTGWLTACPPAAIVCDSASDCASDQVCVAQVCRQVCNSSQECRRDETCQSGTCLPVSGTVADASAVDHAGAIDGSSADRPGADAALSDRLADDIRAADGTGRDATSSDGAAVDRGSSDAAGVDALDPCAGVACSDRGRCSVVNGAAQCECDAGYDGSRCERCAAGYQDRDSDGTCLESCSRAALSCPPHAQCDDGSGAATCVCVTGYSPQGGGCAWTGGPLDPGFTQPDVWQAEGNAAVDPAGAGATDPGQGTLPDAATCGGGALWQSFDMPDYASAEPLVLSVQASGSDLFSMWCWSGLTVYVDGTAYPLAVDGGWRETRICLGERAYGGTVILSFEPSTLCDCGGLMPSEIPSFAVDDVAIGPADPGECLAPGAIDNADFEQGAIGWQAQEGGSGGLAEIASGGGTGGSWAAHLATVGRCDSAAVVGTLSTPLASNALQLRVAGSAGFWLEVLIGGAWVAAVPGRGAFETRRICLIEALRGVSRDIRLLLDAPGGVCADPYPRDFVVDDLVFVDDPACADDSLLVDGDLEHVVDAPVLAQHWRLNGELTALATVEENVSAAHAGNAALRLRVASPCYGASARALAAVPAFPPGEGAALTFWYRAPAVARGTLSFFGGAGGGALSASNTYQRVTACLGPGVAGRTLTIGFSRYGGDGTCANGFAEEVVYFDDVAITSDPGCP